MLRWLLNYTPLATVIRLISLNGINLWLTTFIISFTEYNPELYLLAWIIIASILSIACIIQDFVTSNLALDRNGQKPSRHIHLYEIFVFTVVPVGILSFLTMVCSLTALYKIKQ